MQCVTKTLIQMAICWGLCERLMLMSHSIADLKIAMHRDINLQFCPHTREILSVPGA